MTIQDILDNYDVTESSTFLQLCTCHADYKNGKLIVTTLGEISDQDWATVLLTFPLPCDDYDYDFEILDGDLHVIMLTCNIGVSE
jgi:hypothetical protein